MCNKQKLTITHIGFVFFLTHYKAMPEEYFSLSFFLSKYEIKHYFTEKIKTFKLKPISFIDGCSRKDENFKTYIPENEFKHGG